MYPVHVSGAFLTTPSLSSALYMVLLRLLAREYIFASRLLTSCHTDQALTVEETFILSLVAETYVVFEFLLFFTYSEYSLELNHFKF